MDIVAAFSSRTQALRCSNILHEYGIRHNVVNTPEEIGIGCGLSVKICMKDYLYVHRLLCVQNFSNFKGFYVLKNGRYVNM